MRSKTSPRQDFFSRHALPVFGFLSSDSRQALEQFLGSGNQTFREKRLLEFFKCLDWMPLAEISTEPLRKLEPARQRQVLAEIRHYLAHRDTQRLQDADRRQEYRLRVIAYFKEKIPSQDKALLESLRDYELDLTGRDTNWRHYFTLDSFRRIDEFVNATPLRRQQWFESFRQDVLTYWRNVEKLRQATQEPPEFTFDDWCELFGEEDLHNAKQHRRSSGGQGTATATDKLPQAYRILNLAPGSSEAEAKRQFRQLTRQYHPDVAGGSTEKMQAILGAYEEVRRFFRTNR